MGIDFPYLPTKLGFLIFYAKRIYQLFGIKIEKNLFFNFDTDACPNSLGNRNETLIFV